MALYCRTKFRINASIRLNLFVVYTIFAIFTFLLLYFHANTIDRIEFGPVTLEYNETLHIYMYKQMPIAWVYWNNLDRMPPYIKMSLKLMQCHNHPHVYVALMDEKFVTARFSNEFHPAFPLLKQAHKADYIRCTLLLKFGGLYLDADSVQMGPVTHLFDQLRYFDMVTFGEIAGFEREIPFGYTIMGPIRARSIFLRLWKIKVDGVLSSKYERFFTEKYPLVWFEILRDALLSIFNHLPSEDGTFRVRTLNGTQTYDQLWSIMGEDFLGMFERRSAATLKSYVRDLNTSSEFIIYHNNDVATNETTAPMKNMTISEFRRQNILLNRIFDVSSTRCNKEIFYMPVCFSETRVIVLDN